VQHFKVISYDTLTQNGTQTTFQSTFNRTWISNNTYNPWDDLYGYTGAALGNDGYGNKYRYTINDTMWTKEACLTKKLYAGTALCTYQGLAERLVQFNNSCNPWVTVAINSQNYKVILR
jgi:hypothetical protein